MFFHILANLRLAGNYPASMLAHAVIYSYSLRAQPGGLRARLLSGGLSHVKLRKKAKYRISFDLFCCLSEKLRDFAELWS